MVTIINDKLVFQYDKEILWIEGCGENSLRIRATILNEMPENQFGLLEESEIKTTTIKFSQDGRTIYNGKINATITNRNSIVFKNNNGEILLEEYIRLRAVVNDTGNEDVNLEQTNDFSSTLKLKSREYKPGYGDNFAITCRFEANKNEKIFGMGQYQENYLDLKNTVIELAQRNSQCTIPFYLSNLGYGFLWNNPAIGKVTFAKNITEWKLESTKILDYWITSDETPEKIIKNYAAVVGTVPKISDKFLGLWQSKMRYQTQEEVMQIAKEYEKVGIKPSVIVIDFFHWTEQGNFDFDNEFWPNPKEMVTKLKAMGIEIMISVWPTISTNSINYQEFLEKGFLVSCDRGVRMTMQQLGNLVYFDPTNPEARNFVFQKLKDNYMTKGINLFWLDVTEPGYMVYDYDIYRYSKGSVLEIGNLYPRDYTQMIYDGLVQNEVKDTVSLVRCAWVGSQKFGALLWSGDIDSSFKAFKNQINTGLNVGIAGIPWWTTDIGGFHGGNNSDPEFRELMIRWFQYACFSPILRLHGDRQPHKQIISNVRGGQCSSGNDNEIWSYGEKNQKVFKKFLKIRDALKDYISNLMHQAHEFGAPLMRPLFYDYPDDLIAWETEFTYMFGRNILVAPIHDYKLRAREVYLPTGNQWINANTNEIFEGGKKYTIDAPLDEIIVFYTNDKIGKKLPLLSDFKWKDKYGNTIMANDFSSNLWSIH
ncbi:MAG: glycoside hydrolase family 31 protein [Mycoplasmatales bacterium]